MITPAYSLTSTERVLPRMALDFTTGVLDSRVTVTRALNTATRINSSGHVEIVNANLPRFDYDPVTLAPKGLLIEESRINLTTYSNDFSNAVWLRQSFGAASIPALTPNFAISPDGTQNASRLQMTLNAGTTTADYAVQQHTSTTVVSGASYSYSIWLKSNTASNYIVLARDDGASTATSVLWTVTPTWQRFSYTATTSATGSIGPKLWLRGGLGTSTSADLLIYGAQLEAGAFATSYIPTTTTSLTRNADAVTMTGTNFSNWFNASEGAFDVSFDCAFPVSRWVYSANDGTSNNYIATDLGSAGNVRFRVSSGGVSQANVTSVASILANTVANQTSAFASNSFNQSVNAVLNTTDTSGSVPTINQLQIGALLTTYLNGHVRSLAFYQQRLLNAEIQAFSK